MMIIMKLGLSLKLTFLINFYVFIFFESSIYQKNFHISIDYQSYNQLEKFILKQEKAGLYRSYFYTSAQQNQLGCVLLNFKEFHKRMISQSKQSLMKCENASGKTVSSFLESISSRSKLDQNIDSIIQKVAKVNVYLKKLNNISQSVDISLLKYNPLNLIDYEMQGEKIKHDPQMVLAKLRKLENRAEIHRAQIEISQFSNQKARNQINKKYINRYKNSQQKSKEIRLNYQKIYQNYLKQKQIEAIRLLQAQQDDLEENQDSTDRNSQFNIFSIIKKHPRLIDLTLSRKKALEPSYQKQIQTERKSKFAKKLKENINIQEFNEQANIWKQKEAKKQFQNPERIIERQITKFYLKKNPGKLSHQAQLNQRSLNLIKRQKKINYMIQQNKISKENRKKLQDKFNDLANELAKSDRRRSLECFLPQIKQSQKALYPINNQKSAKEKISTEQHQENQLGLKY